LLEQCEQITLDLTHYLSQHLARYKLPREWKVVDALPKTALGKVQKTLLRDRLLRA
jgi:acyl-CoA synthetase (AMP-forming)/AMP-acid ligase II